MKITKRIPSRLDNIPGLISEIIELLHKELSISEDEIFQVKLALEEAITNAVKHGNKFNPELKVDVSIASGKNKLIIKVKDQGKGFDFDRVPDPTTQEKMLRTSGRGVFLLRKIMDEVSFQDGGREVTMVKVFGKAKDQDRDS